MNIQEKLAKISDVLDGLAPKQDGNLVRSDDWNGLVAQLQALGGIVDMQQSNYEDNAKQIDTLQTDLTDITKRVQTVEDLVGESDGAEGSIISRLQSVEQNKLDSTTFNQYQATLDPLLLQYTVTLETEEVNYLLGEVATLTATVRRLDGSAVDTRPWLDFLVSWGDIQAVSGFTTRPGAGGRSVSVRTNADGVAMVRIKAENLEQTSADTDNEMRAFFATEIGAQNQTKIMRQAIMDAPNPQDGFMRAMYTETTRRYDNGAVGVRYVADHYYRGKFRSPASDVFRPGGSWRNYRSTIAVFAKDDSNPQTPDFGKGVSSIQISFRDWIGPWIIDYQPDAPVETGPWVLDIPGILRDEAYRPEILQDYFDEQVSGRGLLGRHKALESIGAVVRQATESQANPRVGPLAGVIGDAVRTQKNMDLAGDAGSGERDLSAMSQVVQQAASTGAVFGQVTSVSAQVAGIDSKAADLEASYDVLNNRVNQTSAQGESVMLALGSIDNKVGNISVVDADSVRGSVSAIRAEISTLHSKLER